MRLGNVRSLNVYVEKSLDILNVFQLLSGYKSRVKNQGFIKIAKNSFDCLMEKKLRQQDKAKHNCDMPAFQKNQTMGTNFSILTPFN